MANTLKTLAEIIKELLAANPFTNLVRLIEKALSDIVIKKLECIEVRQEFILERLTAIEEQEKTTGDALVSLADGASGIKTELDQIAQFLGVGEPSPATEAELEQLAERLKKSGDDLGSVVAENQP